MKTNALLILVGLLVTSKLAAQTGTVEVSPKAAIFGAGTKKNLPATWGATPPVRILLTPGKARLLRITKTTGKTKAGNATKLPFGDADGGAWFNSRVAIPAWGGISGVRDASTTNCLALMAVFTAGPTTNPPPSQLDVTSLKSNAAFAPVLYQQFFVGDGLTGRGTGRQQIFNIPEGATELWFGFSDAYCFQGEPGWYGDNLGALRVSYSIVRGLAR